MATASAAALAPMTFREVLGLPVMRRVWYAQIVSLLGDFLALFAVISAVTYRMQGTPQQVTGVQIAYMVPLAVLGPLSGVFVDRWPVNPTLIARGQESCRCARSAMPPPSRMRFGTLRFDVASL